MWVRWRVAAVFGEFGFGDVLLVLVLLLGFWWAWETVLVVSKA
jgi:hypothetical protein